MFLAPAAFAALGGPPTLSGASAQAAAQVVAREQQMALRSGAPALSAAAAQAGWSARESTLADGTVEREYLGSDGLVFAVAWRGPRLPDLPALLGQGYATQMANQAMAQRQDGLGSHSQTIQNGADFSVRAVARQRFSTGVAWLPQKLPAGLNPDALGIAPGS